MACCSEGRACCVNKHGLVTQQVHGKRKSKRRLEARGRQQHLRIHTILNRLVTASGTGLKSRLAADETVMRPVSELRVCLTTAAAAAAAVAIDVDEENDATVLVPCHHRVMSNFFQSHVVSVVQPVMRVARTPPPNTFLSTSTGVLEA